MGKKVMRMTTDSRSMEEPKDPDTDHLFQLFSLFVDDPRREEMADVYRRGGFGYGMVKKELAAVAEEFFRAARARRIELAAEPDKVQQILADGAHRARRKAAQVLLPRSACLRSIGDLSAMALGWEHIHLAQCPSYPAFEDCATRWDRVVVTDF